MRRASHEQCSGAKLGAPPRRFSAGGSELVTDDGVDVSGDSALVVEQDTPGEAMRISRQAAQRLRTFPPLVGCGNACGGSSGSDSSGRVSLLSQQLRGSAPASEASGGSLQGMLAESSTGIRPPPRRPTAKRSALSTEIRQHEAATRNQDSPASAREAAKMTPLEYSGRSNSTPLPHITAVDAAAQLNLPQVYDRQELGGMALAVSAGPRLQAKQQNKQAPNQPTLRDSCLRQNNPSHSHPEPSWNSPSRSPPIGLPLLRSSPTATLGAPPAETGRWLETSLGPGTWINISPSSDNSSGSLDKFSL